MHEISLSTVLRSLALLLYTISVVNGSLDGRIVGGNDAEDGKYPYLVRIMYNDTLVCGGTIIDNYHILTAAQCIYRQDPNRFAVVAGTNYLNESGVIYLAEALYWPSDYSSTNFGSGIGIIRVIKEIEFYSAVQSITLVSNNNDLTGETTIVVGWGSVSVEGQYPVKAQETFMRVLLHSTCKKYDRFITRNEICAFTKKNGGTCYGDTGSPMLLNGVQVGIASYNHLCAIDSLSPNKYTNVYPYIGWIQSILYPNSTSGSNTVAPTCAPNHVGANVTNHVHLNIWILLSLSILTVVSYLYSLS